jgi:hypothetical protein
MDHVKSGNWTTRSSRWLTATGFVAVLALTLPACGRAGGDEHHTTSPQAAGTSTANLGSGSGAFCTAARKFEMDQQVIHQAQRGAAQGGGSATSSSVLQAASDSEKALATMQALAPGSLKVDLQVVTNGWKPFFDTLIRARGDMAKVPATVEQGMQSAVKQPQFQRVNSYEVTTCHFQPSAH